MDVQAYLTEKIREDFPDFELREGSVFVDFFIKPLVIILQPVRNEIENVRLLQTLLNYQQMSVAELDSLIANIFLGRRSGTLSAGSVRLFFLEPRATTILQGTAALHTSGLRFLANDTVSVSSAAMSVNIDGALYHMDVPVTAEAPGAEYNIERGTLVALEVPVTGVIRVTNPEAFSGGLSTESNTEFFNRAQTAVTVRNLVNDRSIVTTLLDKFPVVKAVQPIGFNDPEMGRDLLTITLPGPPQHVVSLHRGGHADVYVESDGFSSATTTIESSPQTVGTNNQRGSVSVLDIGLRKIQIAGGFFNGIEFLGVTVLALLPNTRYTLYLALNSTGLLYELQQLTTVTTNPYPAVPVNGIGIANVETDGASVTELVDIRENVFTFNRPIVSIDSIDIVDPVSLQPSGVTLRDGESALIDPSVATDNGQGVDMKLSPGSGDMHLVFKRSTGVFYQRHSAIGAISQAAVLVVADVDASNIRVSPTLQENVNILYLSGGDIVYLRISNVGAVLSGPTAIAALSEITEFDTFLDKTEETHIALIDDTSGSPNVYYARIDKAGVVTQAPVAVSLNASEQSKPAIDGPANLVMLSNSSTAYATGGDTTAVPGQLVDLTASFIADGVGIGYLVRLVDGTGLASADKRVFSVTAVAATQLTLAPPVGSLATGVEYEILSAAPADLYVAWADDRTTENQIRFADISNVGALQYEIVASEPQLDAEETLPRVAVGLDSNVSLLWTRAGGQLHALRIDTGVAVFNGTTGDTDGSRSLIDLSAPFVSTMEGLYVALRSGSGLTDDEFRLYLIDEYVSSSHVRLQEAVIASTAADIEYTILAIDVPRTEIAADFFAGEISSVATAVDNSGSLYVSLVETLNNAGKVFFGKFDVFLRSLMQPLFVRVSSSVNNRDSVSIELDGLRQPYLAWSDFSASRSAIQIAKYQAQEFAYLLNRASDSFSIKEDASIILDPTLEGQSLRINYTYANRVGEVDAYVNDTVNRIVNGNYCTRSTLPAYVDIAIEYGGSGAPAVDAAVTLLTDYINSVGSQAIPPSVSAIVSRSTAGDILEVSDLVDVLYDNGADSVRIGSDLVVELTKDDGTTRVLRSIDKVQVPRTSRFLARSITLTRQ